MKRGKAGIDLSKKYRKSNGWLSVGERAELTTEELIEYANLVLEKYRLDYNIETRLNKGNKKRFISTYSLQ